MLRWKASDWSLEGADKCNSSNSCLKLTGCPAMSKFPQGFWVVKSVRAWAASLIGENLCWWRARELSNCSDYFWRVSACHSAVCSINACCCCCCSWKTWGIVNAEAGAGVVTPPGPMIRKNFEKGEEDELIITFVAVFLLTLLLLGDMF